MRKLGKHYQFVLSRYSDDEGVRILGVFDWVGSATGYVKFFTGNPDRKWESSNTGVLSSWESEPEDGEGGEIYTIIPVQQNPRVEAAGPVIER